MSLLAIVASAALPRIGGNVPFDYRRYFKEKLRSKLRGINACLRGEVLKLVVRPLSVGVEVFMPDHCQEGFAVILIIVEILFCRMKKPKSFPGLGLWLRLVLAIKIIYSRDLLQLRNRSRGNCILACLPNRQGGPSPVSYTVRKALPLQLMFMKHAAIQC